MNAKEHLNFSLYTTTLLGAGYWLGENYFIDDKDVFEILVGVFAGSLLPDVDHKNGTLSKIIPLYLLHNILKKIKIYIFKHGGITHTILINSWVFILAYIYKSLLIVGIGVGYATHIYIDHITGNKLNMLWWPIKIKRR